MGEEDLKILSEEAKKTGKHTIDEDDKDDSSHNKFKYKANKEEQELLEPYKEKYPFNLIFTNLISESIKFSYDKDPKTFKPKDTSKVIEEEIIIPQQAEIVETEGSIKKNIISENDKNEKSKISEENKNDHNNTIIEEEKMVNIQELINRQQISVKMSKRRIFSVISNSRITRNFTFVDYLKAGVQLGLSIAIDFTGSNGNPQTPSSLHFIGGAEPNQYERAIYACGNIVAYYDYDQMFPCYGFGANINGSPTPIFNLSLQPNADIHLIPNIIQEYHKALSSVKLWGPTNFGPILQTTNNIIKAENNKLKYHILMILTDGMIDDVDNTINELVNGSFLPLSVIIIGIGNADFSAMKVLDADENPLISSGGVKAARDLVQFVPFLKYESDPQRLAQEVLAEIPNQILQYYEMNNLDPIKLTS